MSREKSLKYQNEKIRYHKIMMGYYEDTKKNLNIGQFKWDEAEEQIAYHTRLAVYHQKRRALILKHGA